MSYKYLNNKLEKKERLNLKREIEEIRERGNVSFHYPIRATYIFNKDKHSKILTLAPKKLFKKAVSRNLIKRRIRESYRVNKNLCRYNTNIFLHYIGREILPKKVIEEAVKKILIDINNTKDKTALELNKKVRGNNWWQQLFKLLKRVFSFPFIVLIKLYQICISPIKPPTCRFTPTCSEYSITAFKKYGPIKGLWLSIKRLSRCHPWGGSGYDPVP